MMKKKKLGLNVLKVKSFVTSLEGHNENTIKGGTGGYPTIPEYCSGACTVSNCPGGDTGGGNNQTGIADGCMSARACTDLGAGGQDCFVDGQSFGPDDCH